MAHVIRSRIRTPLVLLGLLLSLPAGRAWAQQCLGDCDGNGSASAGDLTKIIAIINYCPCSGSAIGGAATGCAALPGSGDKQCTAADRSGNGCITAGELTGVIANMLNFPDTGCPPGTPTVTPPTQPSFTATVPVVITPTPTDTPIGATNTPVTPPSATNTPVTPATNTPPPSPTNTPSTGAVCGNGVPETGEDCDPGGTCIGGDNAGTPCTSEAQCVGDGVCLSGPNGFKACQTNSECPASSCVHCKVLGTAACAANCTTQTDVPFPLVPGKVTGTLQNGTSGALIRGSSIPLTLPLSGVQTLTIGKPKNGEIPVIIKANTVHFDQIKVGQLACACTRSVAQQTCGGVLTERDGTLATDCSPGWVPGSCSGDPSVICYANDPAGNTCFKRTPTVGAATPTPAVKPTPEPAGTCIVPDPCAGKKPCTYVHGAGNSGTGTIGCNGLDDANVKFFQDAGGNPQPLAPTPPASPGVPQLFLGNACGCSTDNDCPVNGFCSTGAPPESTPTPCSSDSDCNASLGEYCAPRSTCNALNRCSCTSANDCPGGPSAAICVCPNGSTVCRPPAAPGVCVYDPCQANTNCPAPLTCETGPPGSAVIVNSTAIGQVQPPPGIPNVCVVPTKTPISVAPAYGTDHVFCTDDDPQASRGIVQTLPAVTGIATGLVTNFNPVFIETPGQPSPTPAALRNIGPYSILGAPFNCTGLLTPGIPPLVGTPTPGFTPTIGRYATGAGIAGAFGALNQTSIGTIVVTNIQFSR